MRLIKTYCLMAIMAAHNSYAAEDMEFHFKIGPKSSNSTESTSGTSVDSNGNLSVSPITSSSINSANASSFTVSATGIDQTTEAVSVTATSSSGQTITESLSDNGSSGDGSTDNDSRWSDATFDLSSFAPGQVTFTVEASASGYDSASSSTTVNYSPYSDGVIEIDPITGDDYLSINERTGVNQVVTITGRTINPSVAKPWRLLFTVNKRSLGWTDDPEYTRFTPEGVTVNGNEFSFQVNAVDLASDVDGNIGVVVNYYEEDGVTRSNSVFDRPYGKEARNMTLAFKPTADVSNPNIKYNSDAGNPGILFYQTIFDGADSYDSIAQAESVFDARPSNEGDGAVSTFTPGDELWEQYHYVQAGKAPEDGTFTLAGFSISSVYNKTPDTIWLQYQDAADNWHYALQYEWDNSLTVYQEFVLDSPVEAKTARVQFHHRDGTDLVSIRDISFLQPK